ncbi:unnamed protein product, partial [marine sediment metagenome]
PTPLNLYIEGCKNYRTENKRCIKGIPAKAIEISPGVFEYSQFKRQTAHLRSGQIAGVQINTVTRELKANYDKGVVMDNGRVIPFHL